jgi:hypothetical protein
MDNACVISSKRMVVLSYMIIINTIIVLFEGYCNEVSRYNNEFMNRI